MEQKSLSHVLMNLIVVMMTYNHTECCLVQDWLFIVSTPHQCVKFKWLITCPSHFVVFYSYCVYYMQWECKKRQKVIHCVGLH